jgi:hypothetical protein
MDINESDSVSAQVGNILRQILPDFWTREWTYKLQDNSVVRDLIKEDLRIISQNTRAGNVWSDNLKLVNPEA